MKDNGWADFISLLHNRVSCAKLTDPGPDKKQTEALLKAALRAPDHGALQPWRFLIIEGAARVDFGQALHDIKQTEQGTEQELQKALKMPLRAPMVMVVVASPKESKSTKITLTDQHYSTAAAAQNIIIAADVLGLAAIWRTGWPVENKSVCTHLGLQAHESIVGFIYIGSRVGERREPPQLAMTDFVTHYKKNN